MTTSGPITDPKLQKTVDEVENVFALYKKGKSIPEIASELDFAQSYVHDILLCAHTLAEEDIVAVAMLMLEN